MHLVERSLHYEVSVAAAAAAACRESARHSRATSESVARQWEENFAVGHA